MDTATSNNLRHNIADVVELATIVASLRQLSRELESPLLNALADIAASLLADEVSETLATVH